MSDMTVSGGALSEAELEQQLADARAARTAREQETAARAAQDAALRATLDEHLATFYAACDGIRRDLLAGKQLNKLLLRYYGARAVFEQAVASVAAAGPAWQVLANIRTVEQQHALFPALPLLDMYADPQDRQAINAQRSGAPAMSFDGTTTVYPRGGRNAD